MQKPLLVDVLLVFFLRSAVFRSVRILCAHRV